MQDTVSSAQVEAGPVIENGPESINIPNVTALTARLAQILAKEVDLLGDMKINELKPLQEEKHLLVRAMELQLKRIRKYPDLLERIDPQERQDLREMVQVFNHVLGENRDRLLTAREVNLRVVDAIKDVVKEQAAKGIYTRRAGLDYQQSMLSVTLNERI